MSDPITEKKLKWLKKRVVAINAKLSLILSNQQHYLRVRAPLVIRNQKKKLSEATKLLARFDRIPRLRITTSYGGAKRKAMHLFLCTGNEARKLRKMADLDLRMFAGARASLARQRNK